MSNKPKYIYQLKVTLRHSQPVIWRRVLVQCDTTLDHLHGVIQVCMGWQNCHMHLFVTDKNQAYGPPQMSEDGLLNVKDEGHTKLSKLLRKPKKQLTYEYDMGDGWVHDIELEKQLPRIGGTAPAKCIAAARACPPEDVGGLHGYYEFLEAISDPEHPEHQSMRDWYGGAFEAEHVDLEAINATLAQEPWLNEYDEDEDEFDEHPPLPGSNGDTIAMLKTFLSSQEFESQEEAEIAVEQFMAAQQATGLDDFHGLNPNQMHDLLQRPFDSPQLLRLSAGVEEDLQKAPFMRALKVLIGHLQQKPIKLTAKGNLPLAVVKPMFEAATEEDDARLARGITIRSEEDAMPVHAARIVAELAEIIEIKGSKLQVAPKAAELLHNNMSAELYTRLLRTAFTQFNWGYLDGWEGMPGVQATGPFLLWLLHSYGRQWQAQAFYEQAILRAFPALLREVEGSQWMAPEEQVCCCIRSRTLNIFLWLGLIEQRREPALEGEPKWQPANYSICATPLYHSLIEWA